MGCAQGVPRWPPSLDPVTLSWMGFRDHGFPVTLHHEPGSTEGWYTLNGVKRGPFASPELLEADLLQVLARWHARAQELGGWVYRPVANQVAVVLPEDVPVDGSGPVLPWYLMRATSPDQVGDVGGTGEQAQEPGRQEEDQAPDGAADDDP